VPGSGEGITTGLVVVVEPGAVLGLFEQEATNNAPAKNSIGLIFIRC
jgi:hypothetical protein